jgi:hypothetical protein
LTEKCKHTLPRGSYEIENAGTQQKHTTLVLAEKDSYENRKPKNEKKTVDDGVVAIA